MNISTPLTLAVVLVALPVGSPVPSQQPQMPNSGSIAEFGVANVKVIHRFRGESDVVAVRLYLLGGSRQLTEWTAGIETLLLRSAQLEWGREMGATGSRALLETTADWSVVGFEGLQSEFEVSWSALAHYFERPAVSDTSLSRARGELLMAARRRFAEPDLRVREITHSNVFKGHPYLLAHDGTEESLGGIARADLEQYWETQFVKSRMMLVVVGGVSRDRIESLVESTLGLLPEGEYEWTPPPPVPQRESTWSIVQRDLPTNYILGVFGGPPSTDKDYLAFRAALALLSSRLDMKIRDLGSLSYAAYAPFYDRATAVGGVYASTSKPAEAMEIIRQELFLMEGAYFPRSRWRSYLKQFTLEQSLQQMTSDGQAEALARARLIFDDMRMADEYVDQLCRVDLAAVRRVAREYFRGIQYGYLGDTTLMGDEW